MPVDVYRKNFFASSDVFGVDFHPSKPWLLVGGEHGFINIYNLEFNKVIQDHDVADTVLCVTFIARKDWLAAGSKDGNLYVIDYSTKSQVAVIQSGSSQVQCVKAHPTAPIVLTGGNDGTIKAWDWDKGWYNSRTYRGHGSMITAITLNPRDSNMFASACSDGIINMWSTSSSMENFTMSSQDEKLTYVKFYPGTDKPYLITASKNGTIGIWNYVSRTYDKTIGADRSKHTDSVSNPSLAASEHNFAVFHPTLPIIISSYMNDIDIRNSRTYELERKISYNLGSLLCLALRKGTNEVAAGFSKGVVTLELSHGEPIFSVDYSGNLMYMAQKDILVTNIQTLNSTDVTSSSDGAQIHLQTQARPTRYSISSILPSPNGRFVTLVHDSGYIIYYFQEWSHALYRAGLSFAWAPDSDTHAILTNETSLAILRTLKQGAGVNVIANFIMNELYTGPVLGARGPGYVTFWDWETREIVRRIDVNAKNIYWSTEGTHVAITSSNTFYIYLFDRDAYQRHRRPDRAEGVPESFTLLSIVFDSIRTAKWIGSYLMYTTPTRLCCSNRLKKRLLPQSTLEEWESYTISPQIDDKLYLLGYIPAHGRVYVADKNMKVYGFRLSFAVVEFQMAVLRWDIDGARELSSKVPKERVDEVLRYLEGRDMEGIKGLAKQLSLYQSCADLAIKAIGDVETGNITMEELALKRMGDKPRHIADLLSRMVNDNSFTQRQRRYTRKLLSKIAELAGVFPQYMEINGVECDLKMHPTDWGAHGAIYQGYHKGRRVCVKAVYNEPHDPKKQMKTQMIELSFLAHISHPNILPFVGAYYSEGDKPRVCIVSPWMDDGNICVWARKNLKASRKPLVRGILSGLQYLHDLDIIHADLKGQNVLVSDNKRAVVADFGISLIDMTVMSRKNPRGTAHWLAPELILGTQQDKNHNTKESDMWAFACTCFEIIARQKPFEKEFKQGATKFFDLNRKKDEIFPEYPEKVPDGWDEDVWKLATGCWKVNPKDRPTAQGLLDEINQLGWPDDFFSDPEFATERSNVWIDYDRILNIFKEL